MDKRMVALLICAGVIAFGFLSLSCASLCSVDEGSPFVYIFVFFYLGGNFFIIIGSLCILIMGAIFSVLAIVDALSPQKVVNGRYFSRCFLYRVISILCILFCWICHFFMFNQWQYSLGDEKNSSSVLGLVYIICLFGILVLSIALHTTAALHVISGLVASRRQKALTNQEFTLYLLSQFFFVIDFISLIFLRNLEKKANPVDRVDVVRNTK